ncbi:MAG: hypothetical protein ABJC61_09705 [Acidobacteriota bacterium]
MGEGIFGTGGAGYAAPARVEARVCESFAAPPGSRAAGRSLAETRE